MILDPTQPFGMGDDRNVPGRQQLEHRFFQSGRRDVMGGSSKKNG
jgi:hypothetical protein